MNYFDLKNSIKKTVKPFYILDGEDFYFKNECCKLFENLVDIEAVDFNISNFDTTIAPESLMIELSTPPLMSEYRVIFLKSEPKKLEKEKQERLKTTIFEWLKDVCPGVVLIVIDEESNFKNCHKVGEVIDCSKQDNNIIADLVREIFDSKGKQCDIALIKEIISDYNNDMMVISNEISKLCDYVEGNIITAEDIKQVVATNLENDVFKLTDYISNEKNDLAYELLTQLLSKGEQPLKLLALITAQYRRMFICKVSQLSDADLAKELGVKPYAITVSRRMAKKYKPMQLKRILDELQLIEFQSKNGQINMTEGLNLAFLYVTNRR